MPIAARRGFITAERRARLLRHGPAVAMGGTAAGAVGTSPRFDLCPNLEELRDELAAVALDVVVRTSEPMVIPPAWMTPAFGREVDRTRGQLAPLRTREALVTSFSREAVIAATRSAPSSSVTRSAAPPPGPVRIAYAVRWLELGDDRGRPEWVSIVNSVVRDLFETVERVVPGDDQRIGESTR